MPSVWMAAVIAVAACGMLALVLRRLRRPVIAFVDAREERLTIRLAQTISCPLEEAQAAIRCEVKIAPDQTDETILKRARYHHQRENPEQTCAVYRDRAPG